MVILVPDVAVAGASLNRLITLPRGVVEGPSVRGVVGLVGGACLGVRHLRYV